MGDDRKSLFGPTLNDDGTLRCVSASQVKSHQRCKRLWYYDKVLKRPRKPPGRGAKLGTECHERMEKWLKTGVDIRGPLERFGHEMIAPYLHRAPFNGGDMLVEAPLLEPQIMTPGGIRISGFSDVTLPPAPDTVVVLDHKFKKRLAQYADTAEYLAASEPQAVIYTVWALTKWAAGARSTFQHSNHQTEGARLNLPVSITDDRATVFAKWAKLGKYIDEDMAKTALAASIHDVEGAGDTDPSKCRAFGGCDYLHECPSAPHNRFVNALVGGTYLPENAPNSKGVSEPVTNEGYDLMGLLDQMMDAPPAASAAPAPAATSGKLAPVEARECKPGGIYMIPGGPVGKFEGVLGDRAIFKDSKGGLLQCGPDDYCRDLSGDAVSAALFAHPGLKKLAGVAQAAALPPVDTTPKIDPAAGIVPKDAPPDTNPPKTTAQSPSASYAPGNPAQSAEAPKGEGSPSGAEVTAEPKKAGRPPGSKNKPKAETAGGIIVLVNNACPAAEDLMPYVQGLADALAKKHNVADIRLGGKDSGLDYSGWKAVLAVTAKANPPPPGLYVIQAGDLADPVIEALSTVGIVSYGRGR